MNRGLPSDRLITFPHTPVAGKIKETIQSLGGDPSVFEIIEEKDILLCTVCMIHFHIQYLNSHFDATHEKNTKKPKEKEEDQFKHLARYLQWRAKKRAGEPEFFLQHQHEFEPLITKKAKKLIEDQDFFEDFEKKNPDVVKKCVETMAKSMLLEYLEREMKKE
jgi:hypothetical protein